MFVQLKGCLLEQATDQTHPGGLGKKMQKVDMRHMRFACAFVLNPFGTRLDSIAVRLDTLKHI